MDSLVSNFEVYLQGSIIMSVAAAFFGGLLASCTPCVYPMLPITATVVGNNNIGGSKTRGFVLSLIYVIGIAVTYTILGVFAATTGRMFGEINSNPIAFLIVANVMVFLALGMLDVFTIPSFTFGGRVSSKGATGVFITGIASGLVAGPCTAPVLGVLLTYVASSGSIVLGGSLLFIFAIGMGMLLILAGTFSGFIAALPKSGEWMNKIKKGMGFGMLALGEYFLIKTGQLIF